jgi:hypothetical protein
VATDGTVTDGPYPETKEHIGGFAVGAADCVEEYAMGNRPELNDGEALDEAGRGRAYVLVPK